jgi:hypothetical protein
MRPRGAPLIAIAAFLGAVGLVDAVAAGLSLGGSGVGAAWRPSTACTTAGLSVLSNVSGSNVVSVSVATLPAACAGATLAVTVTNGSATGSGSTTVPAGGGSVTVTVGSATAVTTRVETDLVLVGP